MIKKILAVLVVLIAGFAGYVGSLWRDDGSGAA
jgi:hypothetical protein